MKKLFVAIFLIAGFVKYEQVGYCYDSTRYNTWRSTEVRTTNTHFLISTGAIVVDEILVTSGSVADAQFQFYNTTSTTVGFAISSSTFYDIDTAGTLYPIKKVLRRGFAFSNTGNSQFSIKWDYFISVPAGKDNLGRD